MQLSKEDIEKYGTDGEKELLKEVDYWTLRHENIFKKLTRRVTELEDAMEKVTSALKIGGLSGNQTKSKETWGVEGG